MRTLREQEAISFLVTFVAVLGALKLNQYLFFTFNTSPAVILLPSGIGLAAVYLRGYRMWVPLSAAWLLATLTQPVPVPIVIALTAAVAYPLQAVVGAYVLKRLNFLGTMGRARCALIIVGTALVASVIAPSILATAQWLAGSLSAPVWTTWSRAWAGNVLSIMVFTPLITTWYRNRTKKTPQQLAESALALCALALMIYVVFWTPLPQANIFLTLYALFAVLFWIGLRLHPRVVSLALFLTAGLGMAGSFIAHPGATALNVQLFSDELFIVLIAPIFYILGALVEERRANARDAFAHAAQLEEANRRLSREDKAKNEFLATLGHELRNPLAPVTSSLELLKLKTRELQRPDLTELAEIAQTHSTTLTKLLDDLLDVSRISHRKFRLHKETVELRSVVERAVRTVDGWYKSKNHLLSISIPKEQLLINVDSLRLEQMLVNVLGNAAKYTNPGGYIDLSVIHDKERGLRVSVRDNGVGIEPDMLSHIFRPFVQSKRGSHGLGIGLSLAKQLAELHGGEMWAESDGLGNGSEVIIVLPNVQAPESPEALARRRQKEIAFGRDKKVEKKPSRARNVLIVDDNKPAADGLGTLLRHGGHAVSVVYDGLSAIEAMRAAKAEVVLLDLGLPGMDGYAVARQLRQEYGQNPLAIIALTGYGQDEDKLRAQQGGFNYHLTKPVGIAEVEALLAKA